MSKRMPPRRTSFPASPEPPPTVDPRWIVQALLATMAVAVACAYIVLCVLFYFQQWQLVLHPSRTVAQNPSSQGLRFEEVHFSPDAVGQPQLDGWWIPADIPADPTALLLHDGTDSMADSLLLARALHDARLQVFIFDYRGFGRSAGQHPDQKSMQADSDAALAWLVSSGHAQPRQTVVVGDRLGASLAVRLCAQRSDLAGLILQQADGDFASRAFADKRSRIVPFRLLFHEDFPLADPLHALKTPKLLISFTDAASPIDAQRAADPKMTVEIPHASNSAAVHDALRRFLDTYVAQPPQLLKPTH
jgi:uncharacterized protein